MATQTKHFSIIAFVFVFAVGLAIRDLLVPNAVQAAPGPQSVIVTNTPLPVDAVQSGSWNVGITGSPTVSATQSGVWNVGISGTPPVSLAPGASVRDADNPALSPVQVDTLTCTLNDGFGGCNTGPAYTVPVGKRLVVEFISATAHLPVGQVTEGFSIVTTADGTPAAHVLSPSHHFEVTSGSTPKSYWSASPDIRLYADAGTSVTLQCSRHQMSGVGGCTFTFSGYLVNTP